MRRLVFSISIFTLVNLFSYISNSRFLIVASFDTMLQRCFITFKSPKDLCNLKEVEKQVLAPQKWSRTWIGNNCRRHFLVTGKPKHQRPIMTDLTASDGTLFEPHLNALNHRKIPMGQLNLFELIQSPSAAAAAVRR